MRGRNPVLNENTFNVALKRLRDRLAGRIRQEVAATLIGEDDALAALRQAVTCALLAAAGPQRSRVLATLYKDERTARLPEGPLLEKVYLDRILKPLSFDLSFFSVFFSSLAVRSARR